WATGPFLLSGLGSPPSPLSRRGFLFPATAPAGRYLAVPYPGGEGRPARIGLLTTSSSPVKLSCSWKLGPARLSDTSGLAPGGLGSPAARDFPTRICGRRQGRAAPGLENAPAAFCGAPGGSSNERPSWNHSDTTLQTRLYSRAVCPSGLA